MIMLDVYAAKTQEIKKNFIATKNCSLKHGIYPDKEK